MRSPLTPFGQKYLFRLARLRLVVIVSAWVSIFIAQLLMPAVPLIPPLLLIGLQALLSYLIYRLYPRVRLDYLVLAACLIDTAVVTSAVWITGGVQGGFVTIYVWIMLIAALLLGTRWFFIYGLLALGGLGLDGALETLGLHLPPLPQPLIVMAVGQLSLFAVFVAFAYTITRASDEREHTVQGEQVALTRQREQAERARRRWELINTVALHVQESTDPVQVYATIGRQLEELQFHCVIWHWDAPEGLLHLAYLSIDERLVRLAETLLKRDRATFAVPLDQLHYIRQCVNSRTPVLVHDALHSAQRLVPDIAGEVVARILTSWGVNISFSAPMLVGERVIGVLTVWGAQIEADDVPPLAALAQQAASALEKATLLAQANKRAAQLQLVSEISARAGAIEEAGELQQQVVTMIADRFCYHFVAILLLDQTHTELHTAAAAGPLAQRLNGPYRQTRETGIMGWVAQTGQTYLAPDVRADSHYIFALRGDDPVRSELAVPLHVNGAVAGVLDLESTQVHAFDASDVAAMETLADQIGAALEKSHALAVQRKRALQLQFVNEIATRVLVLLEVEELFDELTRLIAERFGFENASIFTNELPERQVALRSHAGRAINLQAIGYRQSWDVGLIGFAARTGTTVCVNDVRADARYYTAQPDADICRAELVVPLKQGVVVLGLLDLQSSAANAFDGEDIRVMETLANQIALALEKGQLLQSERKRAAQLALVNRVAARMTRWLPVDELARGAVESIREQFGYLSAAIFLNEPAQQQVRIAAKAGQSDELPADYVQPWSVGIVGQVAQTGRGYVCSDTEQDPYYISAKWQTADDRVRSELAVPLLRENHTLGVLDIQSQFRHAFDPGDVAALETLADQLAAAVESANYLAQVQQSARELNLLFEIHRATTLTLDPQQVTAHLLEQLTHALDVTSAYFVLLDPASRTGTLVHAYYAEAARAEEHFDSPCTFGLEHFPLTLATLDQGPSVTQRAGPGLAPDQRQLLETYGIQTVLRVPLRHHGELRGYLSLCESRAPRSWSERELRFIQTVAAYAAAAFDNAQLYTETRNRTRELEALYQASQRLGSSLAVNEICETSVQALCEILGYQHVCIFLAQDSKLRLQVQHGYDPVIATLDVQQGVMARALRTRQAVFLPEVADAPEFIAALPKVQSELAVPLVHGDRALGVLDVETLKPLRLTEADARLVQTFANQLAIAIENARLYQETQRRLGETQTLYEFTASLGQTVGVEALARGALASLTRLIPFDIGEISLLDAPTGVIFPLILEGSGLPAEALAGEFRNVLHLHSLHRGMGIAGWVVEHGESVCSGDVTRDPRYLPWSPRIQSELCVPLRAGERIIGLINLEAERRDAFDAHAEKLLSTLANQLAIALLNAQLYEQTKQDAEIKAAMLREVSHRVKNNLAAITSLLHLTLQETGEAREQTLHETLERVQSMVLAHTLLERSDRARVDLVEFGCRMVNEAVHNLAPPGVTLQVQAAGAAVEITPRQLTPLALILNELATNAVRHGFVAHQRTTGRLDFQVERQDSVVQFTLADDGEGLPDGFTLGASAGLGLSLIRTLVAKDLQGIFTLERHAPWTRATVRFALEE